MQSVNAVGVGEECWPPLSEVTVLKSLFPPGVETTPGWNSRTPSAFGVADLLFALGCLPSALPSAVPSFLELRMSFGVTSLTTLLCDLITPLKTNSS
jgi:hypothetical protein